MMSARSKFISGIMDDIEEAIKRNGEFTHNIISLRLRALADKYGPIEANRIVRDLALGERYGIQELDLSNKK